MRRCTYIQIFLEDGGSILLWNVNKLQAAGCHNADHTWIYSSMNPHISDTWCAYTCAHSHLYKYRPLYKCEHVYLNIFYILSFAVEATNQIYQVIAKAIFHRFHYGKFWFQFRRSPKLTKWTMNRILFSLSITVSHFFYIAPFLGRIDQIIRSRHSTGIVSQFRLSSPREGY
jgi:hypothetical protein